MSVPINNLLFVFIVVLTLVLIWYGKSEIKWQKVQAEPSTEIYAVQLDQIRRFVYNNPESKLIATRKSSSAGEFQIKLKFKNGRPPEKCISRAGFMSILSKFCSIRAKRTFKDNSVIHNYPVVLGSVVMEDYSNLSPASWKFRSTNDKSAVLAIDEMQSYEVNITADFFEQLKAGCNTLSKKKSSIFQEVVFL